MSENHSASRGLGTGDAREFFHEELVGQSVKAVTADALRLEPPRDGQLLRDARQAVVKCGVKAGYLRHFRKLRPHGFNHGNPAGRCSGS